MGPIETFGYYLIVFTAEHPELSRRAVEVVVRWSSPVNHMKRQVLEDVEIRGQKISAGDFPALFYASANRDEDVFEAPFRFDIARHPNRHLGFGTGEHLCLGAHLARASIRALFEEIGARVESLEYAGESSRIHASFVVGPKGGGEGAGPPQEVDSVADGIATVAPVQEVVGDAPWQPPEPRVGSEVSAWATPPAGCAPGYAALVACREGETGARAGAAAAGDARRWPLRSVPAGLRRRYQEDGSWGDETLGALLHRLIGAHRRLGFRIWSRTRPFEDDLDGVYRRALAVAGGLRGLGVGPGDVVAFQLPNWSEAAETFYGVAALGATLVPIVHFYGPKELRYILRESGARVLVTADRFGRQDHLAGLEALRPELPALEHAIVVRAEKDAALPDGVRPFEALAHAPPLAGPAAVDPDWPAVVGYTSGTTATPKGVIHTHRSLVFEVRQLGAATPPSDCATLVGAPVAHAIGMLSGLLLPLHHGRAIHLLDVWEPAFVLDAMLKADLTSGNGSTYFLTSLLDAPAFGPEHAERIPWAGLGGSPVPVAVSERAEALGISVTRHYGSTEHPSTTGSRAGDPREKRHRTDGHTLPGVELRLVDSAGAEVGVGEPGEIWSRGPDLCAGYTDPALNEAFTADGWYRTGDVGILDAEGYLTITDRLKDIIIRGGENVSAAEVEEVLQRMPGIAEVAVVAAPDPRLGEHGCAFVRTLPDAAVPDLAALRRHLEVEGMARQKWPEELRVLAEFPRTPSGKIVKAELRRRLREEGG